MSKGGGGPAVDERLNRQEMCEPIARRAGSSEICPSESEFGEKTKSENLPQAGQTLCKIIHGSNHGTCDHVIVCLSFVDHLLFQIQDTRYHIPW
jgi:hypothetical protein